MHVELYVALPEIFWSVSLSIPDLFREMGVQEGEMGHHIEFLILLKCPWAVHRNPFALSVCGTTVLLSMLRFYSRSGHITQIQVRNLYLWVSLEYVRMLISNDCVFVTVNGITRYTVCNEILNANSLCPFCVPFLYIECKLSFQWHQIETMTLWQLFLDIIIILL